MSVVTIDLALKSVVGMNQSNAFLITIAAPWALPRTQHAGGMKPRT